MTKLIATLYAEIRVDCPVCGDEIIQPIEVIDLTDDNVKNNLVDEGVVCGACGGEFELSDIVDCARF